MGLLAQQGSLAPDPRSHPLKNMASNSLYFEVLKITKNDGTAKSTPVLKNEIHNFYFSQNLGKLYTHSPWLVYAFTI